MDLPSAAPAMALASAVVLHHEDGGRRGGQRWLCSGQPGCYEGGGRYDPCRYQQKPSRHHR